MPMDGIMDMVSPVGKPMSIDDDVAVALRGNLSIAARINQIDWPRISSDVEPSNSTSSSSESVSKKYSLK